MTAAPNSVQCVSCATKSPSARCPACTESKPSNYACPRCPESELWVTQGWLSCKTCGFVEQLATYEAKLASGGCDQLARDIRQCLAEDRRKGERGGSSSKRLRDDKLSVRNLALDRAIEDDVTSRLMAWGQPRNRMLNVRTQATSEEIALACNDLVEEFIAEEQGK